MKFRGTNDIKVFVKHWINRNKQTLNGKVIVDLPAGVGVSSRCLKDIGGQVEAYDLFPEFFKHDDIPCKKVDMTQQLPISDKHADYIICQEGIEHVPNQLQLLTEFNRVLNDNGRLIITTPNYSNLLARTSYWLQEAERYRFMPPNELDSIWYSNNAKKDDVGDIYFGHIFLIGIQKLRLLALIAGFEIKAIHSTKANKTALLLFPFQYPFVVLANLYSYFRINKRKKDTPKELRKSVYWDQLKLALNPKLLLDNTLFVEFEKISVPKKNLAPFCEFSAPPA